MYPYSFYWDAYSISYLMHLNSQSRLGLNSVASQQLKTKKQAVYKPLDETLLATSVEIRHQYTLET